MGFLVSEINTLIDVNKEKEEEDRDREAVNLAFYRNDIVLSPFQVKCFL